MWIYQYASIISTSSLSVRLFQSLFSLFLAINSVIPLHISQAFPVVLRLQIITTQSHPSYSSTLVALQQLWAWFAPLGPFYCTYHRCIVFINNLSPTPFLKTRQNYQQLPSPPFSAPLNKPFNHPQIHLTRFSGWSWSSQKISSQATIPYSINIKHDRPSSGTISRHQAQRLQRSPNPADEHRVYQGLPRPYKTGIEALGCER